MNFSFIRILLTSFLWQISGSLYQSGMNYLTTLSNDPDTHEDFKPTSKLQSSEFSAKDIVEQVLVLNCSAAI